MYKAVVAAIFLIGMSAFAEVKPADIFTNFSMLQRNESVHVWGTADPGETVTVEFAGQTKTAETSASGEWMVTLDPMPASSEPRKMTIRSSSNPPIQYSNVLVGEVWFAGGQSNMQTTMGYYKKTSQPDIDSANDPFLRLVTIPTKFYEGHNNKKPQWKDSNPDTVREFSATAYYFAKNLRETLDVPVGIISCAIGGTPAEAWISREVLENNPKMKPTLEGYEAAYHNAFSNEAAYLQYTEDFNKESTQWYRDRNAGKEVGPRPKPKMGPRHFKRPSGLYENMFLSAVPYTVRGVIWYQGEENASSPAGAVYRTVFSELIKNWREQFRNDKLPFLFVQLATVGNGDDKSGVWPELRESQKWVDEHVDNTGMIVLADGGERKSVHPHSKDKAGYRLSLLARNMVYGETNLVCRGPELQNVEKKPGCLELTFDHVGSGLILKPVQDVAFEVCGPDGKYVPAESRLENGKIIVSAESVPNPQYVRYGWYKWFTPILYNEEDLPASPFRTDSFPAASEERYYLDKG